MKINISKHHQPALLSACGAGNRRREKYRRNEIVNVESNQSVINESALYRRNGWRNGRKENESAVKIIGNIISESEGYARLNNAGGWRLAGNHEGGIEISCNGEEGYRNLSK